MTSLSSRRSYEQMSRQRDDGHQLISDIAKGMTYDEQLTGQVCPFCDGGNAKEKSLSIKRIISGALYDCHRAGCGASGIANMNILDFSSGKDVAKKRKSPAVTDLLQYDELPEHIYKILTEKYRLTKAQIAYGGIKWIPKMKRVAFPIKRFVGYPVGIVARSFEEGVKPKSLTFLHTADAPVGAFYPNQRGSGEWWVVEDQISALRISAYANAVAMCGAHLNEAVIADMKRHAVSRLIFAFDSDAFDKALQQRKRYEGLFDRISIRKPRCDPKDMPEEELREFVKAP
jgi:hypothetical protein